MIGAAPSRQLLWPGNHRRSQPALLILVLQRCISTDTATPGAGTVVPPPGFNPNQAKKPLPRDTSATKRSSKNEGTATASTEKLVDLSGPVTGMAKLSAADNKDTSAALATSEKALDKKKGEKKTTVWQKVKHGVQHFWDGTKLLGAEIKISSNLALKMAAGYELSRRERRQV